MWTLSKNEKFSVKSCMSLFGKGERVEISWENVMEHPGSFKGDFLHVDRM